MNHELLMELAIAEARSALEHHDVPVGAVVVRDGTIVSTAHNERELLGDPTAHAELVSIKRACRALNTSRLDGATLITTLEPCPMCAGAALLARVERVVFGAADPKAGALGSLYNLGADPRLNHEFEVVAGVLAGPCAELLREFFSARRS